MSDAALRTSCMKSFNGRLLPSKMGMPVTADCIAIVCAIETTNCEQSTATDGC